MNLIDLSNLALKTHEKYQNKIEEIGNELKYSIEKGGRIFLAGNGGSYSLCSHFAGELSGRFNKSRPSIPCINLGADPGVLTCIGNDYSFSEIYSHQLEGYKDRISPHDILIVFTSSGNSENLIEALKVSKEIGLYSIALSGKGGGSCADLNLCDDSIIIESDETALIQDIQSNIMHIWCQKIDELF